MPPVFEESRRLLDKFSADNPDLNIKWNKLYADYLFKNNDAAQAYLYQNKYIQLKDSVDATGADLYRLDVER